MDGERTLTAQSGTGRIVVPSSEPSPTVVVELHGDIDVAIADVLEDWVDVGIESGSDVVVDLAHVTLIDSAFLAALSRAGRRADRRGRSVRLVALPPLVRRVLAVAGLASTFPVTGDRWQALGELSPEPGPVV